MDRPGGIRDPPRRGERSSPAGGEVVLIDGRDAACLEDIKTMAGGTGEAVFEVGSGRYTFTAPL